MTKTKMTTPAPIRKKGSFALDVLKLASGTTLAQVLTVLIAPVIARLYAPDAFGTATLFISVLTIIGVVSCLRYEFAIMLPERDEDAANLLALSICATLGVTAVSIIPISVARFALARWLNAPDLARYLWLIPLAVLANGIFLALNYWNSRTKHFGRLSIARVSQSLVTNGTQLGLGIVGQTEAGGLIGGRVLGSLAVTTVLGAQIWRDDGLFFLHNINWRQILQEAKRYSKFPLYDAWAALLNTISWQLPSFLLSAFFSTTVVGYYGLGYRVLSLPMNLIGSAIAQVFFQRAAEAKAGGTLATVAENTFRRLVVIGMFPMLTLTIIGRDMFTIVFGDNWAEAGVYVQILSVWVFFWFISSPLSTLFRVLERQEFSLVLNIVILVTRFISLVIGGVVGSTYLALGLFAGTGVLVYGYFSLAILFTAGVSWVKMARIILSSFALFIPVGVILVVLKLLAVSSWVLVITACFILGIYFLYVSMREPQVRGLFRNFKTARE